MLQHYASSLYWLKHYITKRKQYTCTSIEDYFSDQMIIKYGVPQGYILGPLLFTIYIIGISITSYVLGYVIFVDVTIFLTLTLIFTIFN